MKRPQCKDTPDRPILEFLAKNPGKWHNRFFGNELDTNQVMPPGTPEKLVLAKMAMLIRRGLVDGCRGDFEITEKGLKFLAGATPCADCGRDTTNDRACNGDGVIRCNACAIAKYKRDCPLWFVGLARKPMSVTSS